MATRREIRNATVVATKYKSTTVDGNNVWEATLVNAKDGKVKVKGGPDSSYNYNIQNWREGDKVSVVVNGRNIITAVLMEPER